MKINKAGLSLIKEFEGLRLTAYQDPVGIWTIGWGHTGKVDGKYISKGMKITEKKAEELLLQDIKRFENHVNTYHKKYKFNENEFSALVSFAYNIGNINQLTANGTRCRCQIADKIPLYCNAGGKKLAGLVRRRNKELILFKKVV